MLAVNCYIGLETTKPLSSEDARAWYQHAKATLPEGVTSTAQVVGEKGGLVSVAMVARNYQGRMTYLIPLTRDLTEAEGEAVAEGFECADDLGASVVASSSYASLQPDADVITIDDERYATLCSAWAKRQHDVWMADRLAAGWRYGDTMNLTDRTHPMLRPWDNLAAAQKGIDPEAPMRMVQLLHDEGYSIISNGELAAIKSLLRQQAS